MIIPPITAFLLFPAMLLMLELGHRYRKAQASASHSSVIEGALFALFGLLLAFTFSGAIARYDNHRNLVVEESNDIGTAYLRLDLLPPASQPALRQLFREYTTSRLDLYKTVGSSISPTSLQLQRHIWQQSVAATAAPGANIDATKLLLPSLNAMIDITSTRQNAFNLHPPPIVFLLLFAFSIGGAYLAGYSITTPLRNWLYFLAFAFAVTVTIYATLEIEFPRQGLIKLIHTDNTLVELRNSMN